MYNVIVNQAGHLYSYGPFATIEAAREWASVAVDGYDWAIAQHIKVTTNY